MAVNQVKKKAGETENTVLICSGEQKVMRLLPPEQKLLLIGEYKELKS